ICSIASLVAAGPAKYAAGSPGNACVNTKVTITTPTRLGTAITSRLRTMLHTAGRILRTSGQRSRLGERAIVELAVEPVAIACHVLLHRDVEIRLEYWNPRHVDERFADETLDARLVSRVIAFRCGFARRVDERIHVLILVAHGVEDRILAVVGPEEEVFRVIEP